MSAPEMVDCPACHGKGYAEHCGLIGRDFQPRGLRRVSCGYCAGTGTLGEARRADLIEQARDHREAAADDRAHAWRERRDEPS